MSKNGLQPAYEYFAVVLNVVDGDTVDLAVDVGFDLTIRSRFRLYGVDTPEKGQAGNHEATAAVREMLPDGARVTVRTYRSKDKYGRYLAVMETASGLVVSSELLRRGLAVGYYGGTKGVAA